MNMLELRKEYDERVGKLARLSLEFPWESKHAYAGWLAQTYYFVVNSTRLISLAGSMFASDLNPLHFRFIDHAKEERGHENLATSDLKVLGYHVGELPELSQTAGFHQSQYYWIFRHGPESFFGYILCLEGLCVRAGAEFYRRVVKAHGEKAGRFLKVHSEEDIEHIDKALQMVESVPAERLAAINKNLAFCCDSYASILKEVALAAREVDKNIKGVA